MMKLSDVKVATALIIQGYLRSTSGSSEPESYSLQECLGAIKNECDDWADGLKDGTVVDNDAVEPEVIDVDLNVPRTPYNIRSAIKALADELSGLDGTTSTIEFNR